MTKHLPIARNITGLEGGHTKLITLFSFILNDVFRFVLLRLFVTVVAGGVT
jgi:hypothetical protein